MKDPQAVQEEAAITCACGHPESEHSQCTGECYLCACKHYTQARKIGPDKSALLALAYRYILFWKKPATGTDGERTEDKRTKS